MLPPDDLLPSANTLAADMRLLKDDVADIKSAIIGNPQFGQAGLVARVAAVEVAVAAMTAERAAEANARRGAVWVVGAAAAALGTLGGIVGALIKAFFIPPAP